MIDGMRALLNFLFALLLLTAVGATAAWFWAGRAAGPAIDIRQPGKFVGQASTLDMTVEAPGGYRFDIGPTFFLYPQILADIFASCGERLSCGSKVDHLPQLDGAALGGRGRIGQERRERELRGADHEQVGA